MGIHWTTAKNHITPVSSSKKPTRPKARPSQKMSLKTLKTLLCLLCCGPPSSVESCMFEHGLVGPQLLNKLLATWSNGPRCCRHNTSRLARIQIEENKTQLVRDACRLLSCAAGAVTPDPTPWNPSLTSEPTGLRTHLHLASPRHVSARDLGASMSGMSSIVSYKTDIKKGRLSHEG